MTIGAGGSSLTFEASMAAAGAFAAGKWQATPSLAASVKENHTPGRPPREAYNAMLEK